MQQDFCVKNRKCIRCKKDISKLHFNSKRCKPCADIIRKKPLSTLTDKQKTLVLKFAGKMYVKDIIKKVKCSKSNLVRFQRDHGISLNYHSYKKDVIEKVCRYYEKHGKIQTQKMFPDVRVRSIVERYKLFKPLCIPWKEDQVVELLRYSGLLSFDQLAKKFNRPNAYRGSIRSKFSKDLRVPAGYINGLPFHKARHFCDMKKVTIIQTHHGNRKLILWCDIKKHLHKDQSEIIFKFVDAMAMFQNWIWNSQNPKQKILRAIKKF